MSTDLTDQQQRAVVVRDVSVVLSSGAGCGKTSVLTERYLSHLKNDEAEVGQIVAITFTDRAAREMRGRIRQALTDLLKNARDDADAAKWTRHLRNLETAPISTIHAFCGAVLRQHAVEAGLDPRFDVLEEVLSVNLESEALDTALQKLLTAKTETGEDLRQLILLYGWRPVVESVQYLLRKRDGLRWRQWLDTPPEKIAAAWLEHGCTQVLPTYVKFVFEAKPAIASALALLRRHAPLPGPMADNVQKLFAGVEQLTEAPELETAVDELTEAAKVGRVGAKAWPDPVIYEQIKDALTDFREKLRAERLERFTAPAESLEPAVEVGRRFLRVTEEVALHYAARKRQHGVVDFQDLLSLTRDLLREHADVRARLQERYRFLLIDELQDTDPVQMEIVEHLCGAGLETGKLFTVGDTNQSIYRFRGADVTLFRALRTRVPHDGRLGLTLNFRSQPAILHFANALLGHRLADYAPLKAHQPQQNPGPCVEFLWAPKPDKSSAAEGRIAEARWIARRVAAMIGREKIVREEKALRPVCAGDVVLLFRAMTNVHLYEGALREVGLDYYLVGGRAFFAQQEIYDLLNLLRALENPQDALSLAGTLRSPFCCVSDEALFVLGRHRDGLWAGLLDEDQEQRVPTDQRERVRRARRNLLRWRGLKDRLPIARLLGEIFADTGYDAATQFEFLGDRKLANFWKLLDVARTFDRSGLFGLAEFIERLGDFVRTQPREEQAATQPENADVIRLMSIHQAKGLEFPIVIVPDIGAKQGDAARPLAEWHDALGCVARPPADEETPPFPGFGWEVWKAGDELEDWHEDLRTLYVACTRARDYLILSAAVNEPFRPTNAWTLVLLERFDPANGRCLVSDIAEEERPQVRVFDEKHPPPETPRVTATEKTAVAWEGVYREVPVETASPQREARASEPPVGEPPA